jgi:diguanylate cyclase (GGDEF)-like protein
LRILVADDDLVSRTVLERSLHRRGHEVITAGDGETAWKILQGPDAPRLALLDWMMPGRTGPEICKEIRRRVSMAYSYLVLVTSSENKVDVIHGLEAGADDYLTKPINPAELHARLRAGLRILELEDKLVAAREEMQFKATHDALTRLMNRAAVDDFLRRELARSRREQSPLGLLFADIDHFKSVNDKHGHAVGDAVIRKIANRLAGGVRAYDAVGRYGGEEFLIVLPGCDTSGVMDRAHHLLDVTRSRPFETAAGNLQITASIGAACDLDCDSATVASFVHVADVALYRAKHEGRNRVVMAEAQQPERLPGGILISQKQS